MKTVLRYVGNFAEIGYDNDPAAPSLVLLRGKRVAGNKQAVVEYLKAGVTLIFSPGRDQDVLDDTKLAGSTSIATDGTFVWPRTLAYYVEHYDVELPADFEAHMERNQWRVPSGIDVGQLERPMPKVD